MKIQNNLKALLLASSALLVVGCGDDNKKDSTQKVAETKGSSDFVVDQGAGATPIEQPQIVAQNVANADLGAIVGAMGADLNAQVKGPVDPSNFLDFTTGTSLGSGTSKNAAASKTTAAASHTAAASKPTATVSTSPKIGISAGAALFNALSKKDAAYKAWNPEIAAGAEDAVVNVTLSGKGSVPSTGYAYIDLIGAEKGDISGVDHGVRLNASVTDKSFTTEVLTIRKADLAQGNGSTNKITSSVVFAIDANVKGDVLAFKPLAADVPSLISAFDKMDNLPNSVDFKKGSSYALLGGKAVVDSLVADASTRVVSVVADKETAHVKVLDLSAGGELVLGSHHPLVVDTLKADAAKSKFSISISAKSQSIPANKDAAHNYGWDDIKEVLETRFALTLGAGALPAGLSVSQIDVSGAAVKFAPDTVFVIPFVKGEVDVSGVFKAPTVDVASMEYDAPAKEGAAEVEKPSLKAAVQLVHSADKKETYVVVVPKNTVTLAKANAPATTKAAAAKAPTTKVATTKASTTAASHKLGLEVFVMHDAAASLEGPVVNVNSVSVMGDSANAASMSAAISSNTVVTMHAGASEERNEKSFFGGMTFAHKAKFAGLNVTGLGSFAVVDGSSQVQAGLNFAVSKQTSLGFGVSKDFVGNAATPYAQFNVKAGAGVSVNAMLSSKFVNFGFDVNR